MKCRSDGTDNFGIFCCFWSFAFGNRNFMQMYSMHTNIGNSPKHMQKLKNSEKLDSSLLEIAQLPDTIRIRAPRQVIEREKRNQNFNLFCIFFYPAEDFSADCRQSKYYYYYYALCLCCVSVFFSFLINFHSL